MGFINIVKYKKSIVFYYWHILNVNWKEGNILFNNDSIFCCWLYGIGHMIKNDSNNETKPTTATWWVSLTDLQQGIFNMYHPMQYLAYHCICYTRCWTLTRWETAQWVHSNKTKFYRQDTIEHIPVMEHWLGGEIREWVH